MHVYICSHSMLTFLLLEFLLGLYLYFSAREILAWSLFVFFLHCLVVDNICLPKCMFICFVCLRAIFSSTFAYAIMMKITIIIEKNLYNSDCNNNDTCTIINNIIIELIIIGKYNQT